MAARRHASARAFGTPDRPRELADFGWAVKKPSRYGFFRLSAEKQAASRIDVELMLGRGFSQTRHQGK